jgi:hypothetical protein
MCTVRRRMLNLHKCGGIVGKHCPGKVPEFFFYQIWNIIRKPCGAFGYNNNNTLL